MASRMRWLFGLSVAMSCLCACGPVGNKAATRTSTTTTTLPSSTTSAAAAPSEACPPGCVLPSDYDAITVLASSATLVAIVSAGDVHGSGSTESAVIKLDRTLQGNPHGLVYPATGGSLSWPLLQTGKIVSGGSYLVFMSYNRGGPCVSSLFSFDPTTQVATFIVSNDGPANEIALGKSVLAVPTSVTLSDLRMRLYPTGSVIYPTNVEEWDCPGP
jgi:hypothetical protein